ncbi:ImmA/IrrE family metallo-endopeptidase [Brevibacillus nitrificans]|uniref:ImmA/IrrE family metallo-endopeptidase n=1 Tax=Brevibacillus nitrificans TaxID=651560 RepID=A0A3M8DPX6_9BACL|nr:ImmA/IrrE family metallo-endopeptidase [Brevibacillus nitrificans]RNB90196.1 ImmA/IrrE family metallo-endopeptidase [Brevibacillus nitrificans]
MLHFYYKTFLENKVEVLYRSHNILSPDHIDIDLIADVFGITIVSLPGAKEEGIWDDYRAAVFLNANKPSIESREAFFHELSHILLHTGNQLSMNRGLLELQEEQANHFQLYAALPFYMIQQIHLPSHEADIIHVLSSEFRVTHQLARKRWEQIQRRVFSGKQQLKFENEVRNQYRRADPSNWSDETKSLYELAIHRKQQKELHAK